MFIIASVYITSNPQAETTAADMKGDKPVFLSSFKSQDHELPTHPSFGREADFRKKQRRHTNYISIEPYSLYGFIGVLHIIIDKILQKFYQLTFDHSKPFLLLFAVAVVFVLFLQDLALRKNCSTAAVFFGR